ncbi:hypothetical protein FN846DRAFT_910153 [Sphaerosporella brunnea]|uniref:Uncharacterized protein n=1 Tax=Sphaerosporella brunnea TaxID=1250544 RepID=A0A5J5EP69_9PEZI|nr:hypothetical protein FN846DRAFT_910153 [Sphaerosporella brunnea]
MYDLDDSSKTRLVHLDTDIRPHTDPMRSSRYAIAFSPDLQLLSVRHYIFHIGSPRDTLAGNPITLPLQDTFDAWEACISSCNKYLAQAAEKVLKLFEVNVDEQSVQLLWERPWKSLEELDVSICIYSMQFHPTLPLLLVRSRNGFFVIDVVLRMVWYGPGRSSTNPLFSECGRYLCCPCDEISNIETDQGVPSVPVEWVAVLSEASFYSGNSSITTEEVFGFYYPRFPSPVYSSHMIFIGESRIDGLLLGAVQANVQAGEDYRNRAKQLCLSVLPKRLGKTAGYILLPVRVTEDPRIRLVFLPEGAPEVITLNLTWEYLKAELLRLLPSTIQPLDLGTALKVYENAFDLDTWDCDWFANTFASTSDDTHTDERESTI